MLKIETEIIMIFFTTLILTCNAFWWRSATEATPLVKQIPVGYFRTYTYHQPMTFPGSFYNNPFNGLQSNRFSTWSQFPSSSSSSNGSPILSNYKYQTQSPILSPPSTPPAPTAQPQLSTQPPTLTLPPAPPQPQYQPLPTPSSNINNNLIGHSLIDSHPMTIQHNNIAGPIPKYQYYYSNVPTQQKPMQQIRFVPCMCPVPVTTDYQENRSASFDDDDDDDMNLPENEQNNNRLKGKENGDDAIMN